MKVFYIENGGPAFPTLFRNYGDINAFAPDGAVVPPGSEHQLLGMSLRDYFAAQALVGLIAFEDRGLAQEDPLPMEAIASKAYELANAMLAAREVV